MQLFDFLSVIALVLVLLVCPFLALWDRYDDGIVGKAALGAISVGAFIVLGRWMLESRDYHFSFELALFVNGVGLFFVRHVWVRVARAWKSIPSRRSSDIS